MARRLNLALALTLLWLTAAPAKGLYDHPPSPPPPPSCDFPPPAADDVVIFLRARDTPYLSSATVAGPDEETHVTFVRIEPGRTKLYLILESSPMIWVFSGATQRIAHAALVTEDFTQTSPPAGAAGVARAKVSMHRACDEVQVYWDVRATLGYDLGHRIDDVFEIVAGGIGGIALPSGAALEFVRAESAPLPGSSAREWTEALRYDPGGVVDIDASRVVGATAIPYDVLPGWFGLAQLVGSGALVRMPEDPTAESFFDRDRRFRLTRAIPRFPTGLGGALSVVFEVPENIPMPAGDPGHSCVLLLGRQEERGATCK